MRLSTILFAVAGWAYSAPIHAKDFCYEVASFDLVYESPHPRLIPISELLNLPITLEMGGDGFSAYGSGEPVLIYLREYLGEQEGSVEEPVQRHLCTGGPCSRKVLSCPRFQNSALRAICETILTYLRDEGLSGVSVEISPDQISPDGKDRRKGCRNLTISIRTAQVGEIGAFRINQEGEKKVGPDSELSFIVSHSPMQPAAGEGPDDLFSKDQLDSYLAFLNRRPNRRVEARIYPLQKDDSKVGIDYLISENRPWRLFVDVGNTGNQVTGLWQETLGFTTSQLSGVDDTLRFDGTTDSFHSFYTFSAAYDRPILAWPKSRWRVQGMFNRFAAADLGFQDKIFVGTQGVVELKFSETAAQAGSFFFDLSEGIRYYNIHVKNRLALVPKGATQFAAPLLGFSFEQIQSLRRFYFKFEGATSPNLFLAANRSKIDRLGRLDTSKGWTILSGQLFAGFYTNEQRPVHEFVFLGQGQYAFNYRLIPQLKFVVGGFNTARGYPEAINSGDSAFVLRGEYIFHLPPFFDPNPYSKTTLFGKSFRIVPPYAGGRADWDFALRVFVDAARSIDNKALIALEENSTLVSTGLGAQIDLWQNFMVRGDWGITLQKAVNTNVGHSIVYFNSSIAY